MFTLHADGPPQEGRYVITEADRGATTGWGSTTLTALTIPAGPFTRVLPARHYRP